MFFLLLLSPLLFSMDASLFDENIGDLNSGNFEKVSSFLNENEKEYEADPEYYVIFLNYSFLRSRNTSVVAAQGDPEKDDFALLSKETNEVVGFLGERTNFDNDLLLPAIQKTQAALKKFPNRLDIHLGITHISKEAELWDTVGEQSVEILEISRKNNNKWLWGSVNGMSGDPREFMLQNIASNCSALFSAENELADKALETVSQSLIENYPKEVYGYANLGGLYAAKMEYKKSYEYYSQALKVAPEDEIVLQNMKHLKSLEK